MDDKAVRRIEIHVRDCLRSLFRMPMRLADNILHAEYSIPTVSIRAHYYRSRLAQRFLDYYCSHIPWHGSIRKGWCLRGMKAARLHSDERMSPTPKCHIAPDKVIGESEGRRIISSLAEQPTIVAFVDGSNKGTGCGCA